MRIPSILLLILVLSFTALGQAKPAPVEIPMVPARTEDVSTLDGIIKAFYETISGPAGQPRQWGRDRTLYIEGMRFVGMDERDGTIRADVMDHRQYVDAVNAYFVREGFFEREIHRVVRTFGNMTHVFSTYESRNKADGPVMERGVNSIQLFHDGKRWWIASAMWDGERKNNPIPADLLPLKKP